MTQKVNLCLTEIEVTKMIKMKVQGIIKQNRTELINGDNIFMALTGEVSMTNQQLHDNSKCALLVMDIYMTETTQNSKLITLQNL